MLKCRVSSEPLVKTVEVIVASRRESFNNLRQSSERTDPDYNDKTLARIVEDYLSLEPEWRSAFLEQINPASLRRQVVEMVEARKSAGVPGN